MICEIQNGSSWFNLTPFIKAGGWKDQRSDVEGSSAGRNLDGTMIRDRICIKYRIDVSCVPIKKTNLDTIKSLIEPESFQIRFKDDNSNDWTYRRVYSNNFSWEYLINRSDGEYYDGFGFPLIEM